MNKDFWNIIDKIEIDLFNFKTEGFKKEYAILKLILLFKNNNIFYFEINRENYCCKCKYNENMTEYLGPIIQINIVDINENLYNILEKKFENNLAFCTKNTWINHGEILLSNIPIFSDAIKNLNYPYIIFIFLDLGNENDDLYFVFENLKNNLDSIKNIIKDVFYFWNYNF